MSDMDTSSGVSGVASIIRSPVAAGVAVAVALAVAVSTVVVLKQPAAPTAPPAPKVADVSALYGRWVKSGNPCDTQRGDMEISEGRIIHHENGVVRSEMKLAGSTVTPPGKFEIKIGSFSRPDFMAFSTFDLKDPTTFILSNYLFQADGIWHKC